MQTKTIVLLITFVSLIIVAHHILKTHPKLISSLFRSPTMETFEYTRGLTLPALTSNSPRVREALYEKIPDATRFNYSTPFPTAKNTQPSPPPPTSNHTIKVGGETTPRQSVVNDPVPTQANAPYVSISQQLAGKQNPKTLVNPIVVQPIANLDYWQASPLVVNSGINNQTNFDTYTSGYQTTVCCNNPDPQNREFRIVGNRVNNETKPQYLPPYNANNQQAKENFSYLTEPNTARPPRFDDNYRVYPANPIDTSFGYHPEYPVEYGVPVNSPFVPSADTKFHNEQVYTQTLQPGIYTTTQVNEPINSNIGISLAQGFEPTTVSRAANGGVMYTARDPATYTAPSSEKTLSFDSPTTVFDPRLTGYGSSNRSYTDKMTGQTRYYYDDINAVRMPNYITRNNLDVFEFMDTYGPMSTEKGNVNTSQIHTFAQQNWFDQTNAQRADLQSSLMRKNMFMTAQRRIAPLLGK